MYTIPSSLAPDLLTDMSSELQGKGVWSGPRWAESQQAGRGMGTHLCLAESGTNHSHYRGSVYCRAKTYCCRDNVAKGGTEMLDNGNA